MVQKNYEVIPYSLEWWNKIEANIHNCRENVKQLHPGMLPKFRSTECAKNSELSEYISEHNTTDHLLLNSWKNYYDRNTSIWFFLAGDWDISEKSIRKIYMQKHLEECPSRALWFTPNWDRQQYHNKHKKTKLSLKQEWWSLMKWFYCIPIDVDKKDLDKSGIPIPERFAEYSKWIDIPSWEFFNWWIDRAQHLKSEWEFSFSFIGFVQQISYFVISPGWFHAYIVINPNDYDKFDDIDYDKYKEFMNWFISIVWYQMFMDW